MPMVWFTCNYNPWSFSKKYYTFSVLYNEVLIVINFPKIEYFNICVQQTTQLVSLEVVCWNMRNAITWKFMKVETYLYDTENV